MARLKGSLGKSTSLVKLAGTDNDPARYLLKVMIDPANELNVQIDAAKALMPYVHRKLPTALEVDGELGLHGTFTVNIR